MTRFIVENGAKMGARIRHKSIKTCFWCELCVKGVFGVTKELFFEHFRLQGRAFGAQADPKKVTKELIFKHFRLQGELLEPKRTQKSDISRDITLYIAISSNK